MLSVIIPVYVINEQVRDYFWECFDRLKKHTTGEYELIVVQNGGEKLDKVFDQFVYRPEPMGFARALNLGLALANGDNLALVSADVFVEAGWNQQLANDLLTHGPGYICPSDNGGRGVFEFSGWGAAWLTTRQVFTQVGYDDERLNHRFSDQDRWIRATLQGFHILRDCNVHVQHFEGSTVFNMPERETHWPLEEECMKQKWGHTLYLQWRKERFNP